MNRTTSTTSRATGAGPDAGAATRTGAGAGTGSPAKARRGTRTKARTGTRKGTRTEARTGGDAGTGTPTKARTGTSTGTPTAPPAGPAPARRAAAALALRLWRRRRRKITFLLHNAYAIGGTVRTTFNLAAALADAHDVEIVSMSRHRDTPRFDLDPRVRLVALVDTRPGSPDLDDPAYHRPAEDFPAAEKRHKQYSRLTDLRVRAHLERCDADVIIGTRPGINVYLARFGPRRALRIAQEHLRHDAHGKRLRAELARHYRSMDALVTMTEADARVYRRRMPLPGVRVVSVPNIVPPVDVPPSDGTSKVIAAAGRLAPGKRYDLLLEAFATVAAKEPDWQLRIYGGGDAHGRLETLIDDLGLTGRAHLMGPRTPIEAEFARASLVVSASDAESFGMTLVEAMRCGVPVISTDCPLGPAEIVTDGVDGRLVPVGDAPALADAMLDLIADDDLRHRMAEAALDSARRYDPAPITARYDQLFAGLRLTRARRTWRRRLGRITR